MTVRPHKRPLEEQGSPTSQSEGTGQGEEGAERDSTQRPACATYPYGELQEGRPGHGAHKTRTVHP